MNEVERIQGQLKRALNGSAWHGPAVLELLADVSVSQAAARPIAGAHTIWELVKHIRAWESAAVRRLNGDRAELPDDEDWPAAKEMTEEAWRNEISKLRNGNEALMHAIASVDESALDQPIMEGMSSIYVTLQGVIQHDLYHAGQIALLKKALNVQ